MLASGVVVLVQVHTAAIVTGVELPALAASTVRHTAAQPSIALRLYDDAVGRSELVRGRLLLGLQHGGGGDLGVAAVRVRSEQGSRVPVGLRRQRDGHCAAWEVAVDAEPLQHRQGCGYYWGKRDLHWR